MSQYGGPKPDEPEAVAGLSKRLDEREERWPLPERWEIDRERMYEERDNNEDVCDHYGGLG